RGDVLFAQANLEGARQAYQEALDLHTKFNDHYNIAASQLALANVSIEEAKWGDAETLARRALEAFESERSADDEASAHESLARALQGQAKRAQAMGEINSAHALKIGDFAVRAAVESTRARLIAVQDLEEARRMLDAGIQDTGAKKLAGVRLA